MVPEFPKDAATTAPSLKASGSDVTDWIEPVAGEKLTFRTVGQQQDVTFIPFNTLFDERYGIYWKVT